MRPELHPACAAFPAVPDSDLHALAADIKQNGLLEPITLTRDGLLLDGRCRWDACVLAVVEPRTVVYDGGDPVGFVMSKNKHRRHLDKSQMAMVTARLVNLCAGSNQFQSREVVLKKNNLSAKELSKQADVALAYINYGRTVLREGEPHVVQMVDAGEINVRVAAEAVRRHDRAAQASWTAADVQREGRKVVNAYPSSQRGGGAAPKRARQEPPKRIDIPYRRLEPLSNEELGYPGEGSSLAEYDAYFVKYGRTPLHPKAIKEMLDGKALAAMLIMGINALTSARHPAPDRLFESLDQLLTHVREPEATTGAQFDFAGEARKLLAMLETALPKALALLTAIDVKLKARRTGRD